MLLSRDLMFKAVSDAYTTKVEWKVSQERSLNTSSSLSSTAGQLLGEASVSVGLPVTATNNYVRRFPKFVNHLRSTSDEAFTHSHCWRHPISPQRSGCRVLQLPRLAYFEPVGIIIIQPEVFSYSLSVVGKWWIVLSDRKSIECVFTSQANSNFQESSQLNWNHYYIHTY